VLIYRLQSFAKTLKGLAFEQLKESAVTAGKRKVQVRSVVTGTVFDELSFSEINLGFSSSVLQRQITAPFPVDPLLCCRDIRRYRSIGTVESAFAVDL